MKDERACEDCGMTGGRRTRCHACNKMICKACWSSGFNCPYPAEDQRKTVNLGGVFITRKPHRANIKL